MKFYLQNSYLERCVPLFDVSFYNYSYQECLKKQKSKPPISDTLFEVWTDRNQMEIVP